MPIITHTDADGRDVPGGASVGVNSATVALAPSPVVMHTRVVTGVGGGPDKTILNSPRFLEPFGYRTICAYMHPPDDPGMQELRLRASEAGATLKGIVDRGPLDWRVVREMLRLCRREQVTIWHGHDYKSNALGLLLRRFWPMHLVTTVHGWVQFTPRTPFYYAVDRLSLRCYEKVICVSQDLFEQCLAAGVPRSRCRLIQNAIDAEQFARRDHRDEVKRRLGLDPGRLLVGAVGRLSAEKGFDLLIRAFDGLLAEGIDAELRILGDGSERTNVERLIAELGRQDRVRLQGYQANTIDWFHAMDIFALSSLREGLPNVVLEAMAMEVPVIATRIAGVPRIVEEGVNGLLVEPGDIAGLCQALRRLIADPALRDRLARAGRQTVEQDFSFAVRMQKIRAIYDDLLQNSAQGNGAPSAVAAEHAV